MISGIAGSVNKALSRVTESYSDVRDAFYPPRRITLEETRDGLWQQAGQAFRSAQEVPAGADVTLILDPARFLVLTLPLPLGAKPYLSGVIASQIDRISPWSPEQAIFGAVITTETQTGLNVRVAIAARDEIERRVSALRLVGIRSLTLRVPTQIDARPLPIDIPFEMTSALPLSRERRVVQSIFFGAIAFVMLSELVHLGFAGVIETQRDNAQREILKLRETLAGTMVGRDLKGDPLARMVHAKFLQTPAVEMLDALSGVVPDHTYLTAIEIEPKKLHIEGISTSVTDLPKAIAENAVFGDVTFSAPTAKRRDGTGETFQIDIAVQPRAAGEP